MTYKEFLDKEEVILEDWRLWAMGVPDYERERILKEWYKKEREDGKDK